MNTTMRFGVVGVANTLVDLIGFTGLCLLGVPSVAANLASLVCNFVLYDRVVFPAATRTSG